MKQKHSGEGDNIGRDKIINNFFVNLTKGAIIVCLLLFSALIFYNIYNSHEEERKNNLIIKKVQIQDSLKLLNDSLELRKNISSSFEIKYITLFGQQIDLLLDTKKVIEPELVEIFGSKTRLISNNVLTDLSDIRRRFGFIPKEESWHSHIWEIEGKKGIKKEAKNRAAKLKNVKVIPATKIDLDSEIGYVHFGNLKEKAMQKLANDFSIEKNCLEKKNCVFTATKSRLQKLLSLVNTYEDIDATGATLSLLSLYNYITSKGLPDNFIKVFQTNYSCDNEGITLFFTQPELKLRVAYIRNLSKENIKISGIVFKKHILDSLRSVLSDKGLYNYLKDTIDYNISLEPNNTLIIPTYFYFQPQDEISNTSDLLNRESSREDNSRKFIYGSSHYLERIIVNNYDFMANQDYTSKEYGFYVYGTDEGGSCPYIYTYSPNEKRFKIENHILFGRNSKKKIGWDTLQIQSFGGKIMIKENDPETSYIDNFYVVYMNNKRTKIMHPQNKYLKNKDNLFLKMNKGDSIILNFPSLKDEYLEAGNFYAISYGFYEPYKQK